MPIGGDPYGPEGKSDRLDELCNVGLRPIWDSTYGHLTMNTLQPGPNIFGVGQDRKIIESQSP